MWWADPWWKNVYLWCQIAVVQSDRLGPINQYCRTYIDACTNIGRTTHEHWWSNICENVLIQKCVKIDEIGIDVQSFLMDHRSAAVKILHLSLSN